MATKVPVCADCHSPLSRKETEICCICRDKEPPRDYGYTRTLVWGCDG